MIGVDSRPCFFALLCFLGGLAGVRASGKGVEWLSFLGLIRFVASEVPMGESSETLLLPSLESSVSSGLFGMAGQFLLIS